MEVKDYMEFLSFSIGKIGHPMIDYESVIRDLLVDAYQELFWDDFEFLLNYVLASGIKVDTSKLVRENR
nr:MAG: hypothetical protein [Microvirus sp.]